MPDTNSPKVNKRPLVLLLGLFLLGSAISPVTTFVQGPKLLESELLEVGQAKKLPSLANTRAEFKVVSYNIRWRGGDDLRKLIQLFKDDAEIGGATIIGLQEVDRNKQRTKNTNTVKMLAEELGKHYVWAAPPSAKTNDEEETGVAILSSYPVSEVQRIVLPHEGPGRRRRAAIGATVTIGTKPLRVYSVHSENRISVPKKLEQMRAVLQNLAAYPRDLPVIILGDLNTWEPDAVDGTSELFAQEKFTTPFGNGQSTFRRVVIFPIEFKLDWIWLRGLEATSHGIDRKIDLSDHFPLWAVLQPSQPDQPRARKP